MNNMQAAKAAKALRDTDLVNITAPRLAAEASIEAHEAWMAKRSRYGALGGASNYYKNGAGGLMKGASVMGADDENSDDDGNGTKRALLNGGADGGVDDDDALTEEGLLAAMARSRQEERERVAAIGTGEGRTPLALLADSTLVLMPRLGDINEKNAELGALVHDREELLLDTADLQIENSRNQARTLQERNDASRRYLKEYDFHSRCPLSSHFTDDSLSEQLRLTLYPSDVRGYVNPVLRRSLKTVANRTNGVEAATTLYDDHTERTAKELQRLCAAITTGDDVAPAADSIVRASQRRSSIKSFRMNDSTNKTSGGGGGNLSSVEGAEDVEVVGEDDVEEEEEEEEESDIANLADTAEADDDDDASKKKKRSASARKEKAAKELEGFLNQIDGDGSGDERKKFKTVLPRDFHSGLRHILELLCELVLVKNRRVIHMKEENIEVAKEKLAEQELLKGLIAKTREEAVREKERLIKNEELARINNPPNGTNTTTTTTSSTNVNTNNDNDNSKASSATTAEIRRIRAERKAKDKALDNRRKQYAKEDEAKVEAIKERLVPLMSAYFPSVTTVKRTAEEIAEAIAAEIEAQAEQQRLREEAEAALAIVEEAPRPPRPTSATNNARGAQNNTNYNNHNHNNTNNITQQHQQGVPTTIATTTARPQRPLSASMNSFAPSSIAPSATAIAAAKGAIGLLVTLSLTNLTQLAVKISGALSMSNIILAQVALTDEMFEKGLALVDSSKEAVVEEERKNRGPNAEMSPARKAAAESKEEEKRIIEAILSSSKEGGAKGTAVAPSAPATNPSGLVDDSSSSTNPAEEKGSLTRKKDGDNSKGEDGKEEEIDPLVENDDDDKHQIADVEWYESARLEYLKRLDVAMLVTKERLIQMMMLKEDPTDAVAEAHKAADEAFLAESIAKSEQLRAQRRLNFDGNYYNNTQQQQQQQPNNNGKTYGGVSIMTTNGAGSSNANNAQNMSLINVPLVESVHTRSAAVPAAAAKNKGNNKTTTNTALGGSPRNANNNTRDNNNNNNNTNNNTSSSAITATTARRTSVQFDDSAAPPATGIAVTVNGLTTGGPSPARVPTASSALRYKMEEHKRKLAREHADTTATIRGMFEKHHKYCYDTLNTEIASKEKVLRQVAEHDLPRLAEALTFQKEVHERAMVDYAREQCESYDAMRRLEDEQQRVWIEVEEMLEKAKPLQEERHRIVEEHLLRSDIEWERRRHYEEWVAAQNAHKKHLMALKELLEGSNTILQGCRDVHNGMARTIIEAVTVQNVQSRRQSRRGTINAAYRRASAVALQAGLPPPPMETAGQEVTRRLSRILGPSFMEGSVGGATAFAQTNAFNNNSANHSTNVSTVVATAGAGAGGNNNNNNNTNNSTPSSVVGVASRRPGSAVQFAAAAASAPFSSFNHNTASSSSQYQQQQQQQQQSQPHPYGVTYDETDGVTPIRPARVPAVPPLEHLDTDAIFDFAKIMEREDAEAEAEEAAWIEAGGEVFSDAEEDEDEDEEALAENNTNGDDNNEEAELKKAMKEAEDMDNQKSDNLALRALRIDHTHTFISKLYVPFVHTTQALISRKNARLLLAKKALRLYDDLLGIAPQPSSPSSDPNNAAADANVTTAGGDLTAPSSVATSSIALTPAPASASALVNTSDGASTTALMQQPLVTGSDCDRVRALRKETVASVAQLERDIMLLARRVEFYVPFYDLLVEDLAKRERRAEARAALKQRIAEARLNRSGGGSISQHGMVPPSLRPSSASIRAASAAAAGSTSHHSFPPLLPLAPSPSKKKTAAAGGEGEGEHSSPQHSSTIHDLHFNTTAFAELQASITSKALNTIKAWDATEEERLGDDMAAAVATYAICEAAEQTRVEHRGRERDGSPISPYRQQLLRSIVAASAMGYGDGGNSGGALNNFSGGGSGDDGAANNGNASTTMARTAIRSAAPQSSAARRRRPRSANNATLINASSSAATGAGYDLDNFFPSIPPSSGGGGGGDGAAASGEVAGRSKSLSARPTATNMLFERAPSGILIPRTASGTSISMRSAGGGGGGGGGELDDTDGAESAAVGNNDVLNRTAPVTMTKK